MLRVGYIFHADNKKEKKKSLKQIDKEIKGSKGIRKKYFVRKIENKINRNK